MVSLPTFAVTSRHPAGGAANAHGRDRRADLHVAGMRDLAGDERERAFDQAEQRAVVRRRVVVVGEFVERHPRIGDEVERGAVGEADAELRIGAGLDHVALVDVVADIERDRDAVAHHGDSADDLLDLADRVGRRRRSPPARIRWASANPPADRQRRAKAARRSARPKPARCSVEK